MCLQSGDYTMLHSDTCRFLLSGGGSGQWWDCRAGESGRDPEATLPLPQRRSPVTIPLVPGEWASSSRAVGPTTLVTARKGEESAVGG